MATTVQTESMTISLKGSRKRSHSDMKQSQSARKWIDEDHFRTKVLCLYPAASEEELDDIIRRDAQALGVSLDVMLLNPRLASCSVSATTVSSSEPQNGSILSHSTAPTSCSSSEYRPRTSLSTKSSKTVPNSFVPSITSDMEKKRQSGFKSGFLKMAGFRKRKPAPLISSSMSSLKDLPINTTRHEETSVRTRNSIYDSSPLPSSPSYLASSSPTSTTLFPPEPLVDAEALRRSMDCQSMQHIHSRQTEESRRFQDYQKAILDEVRTKRDRLKQERSETHEKQLAEKEIQNEKAVEVLEARQLEEELKVQTELENEKRAVMTRLRYMEAYCQNPSSPTSSTFPGSDDSTRTSIDSGILKHERQITQQHYESLAQQYHRRDTMTDLHASKINVLRGKQKRAVENFVLKKEREIEQMQKAQARELEAIDLECSQQEADIKREFEAKRQQLETRWYLQAALEKTRMEQSTGLKYEPLPAVTALETQA